MTEAAWLEVARINGSSFHADHVHLITTAIHPFPILFKVHRDVLRLLAPGVCPAGLLICSRLAFTKLSTQPAERVVIDSFPSQSRFAASMGHESGAPANLICF
jgi:hypothetical protein